MTIETTISPRQEKHFDGDVSWGRSEGQRIAVDVIDPLLPIGLRNHRRAVEGAKQSPSEAAAVRTLAFHAAMVSTLRAQAEQEAAEAIEEAMTEYRTTGASDAMVASVREALATGARSMLAMVFDRMPADLLRMAEEELKAAAPLKRKKLNNEDFDSIGRFDGGLDAQAFIAAEFPIPLEEYIAASPEKRAAMVSTSSLVERVTASTSALATRLTARGGRGAEPCREPVPVGVSAHRALPGSQKNRVCTPGCWLKSRAAVSQFSRLYASPSSVLNVATWTLPA